MTGRRLGILFGNAAYPVDPALLPLACPLNDVDGMAAELLHPERCAFDTVLPFKDADSGMARRELTRFLKAAGPQDLVVVYYSGHGVLDDAAMLHLCTRDSERELIQATSLPMREVWDRVDACRAKRKVVLLDCCHSGQAAGFRARGAAEDTLRAQAGAASSYLMAASSAIESACEKEGARYGVFTEHLIEGLASGAPDVEGKGFVTMDDLYDYVVREVRDDSPQKPTRQTSGYGVIEIARSGKDSRRERLKLTRKRLFAAVADEHLSEDVARRAVAVAGMRPPAMTPSDTAVDAALTALLADTITLGAFIDSVHAADARTAAERTEAERAAARQAEADRAAAQQAETDRAAARQAEANRAAAQQAETDRAAARQAEADRAAAQRAALLDQVNTVSKPPPTWKAKFGYALGALTIFAAMFFIESNNLSSFSLDQVAGIFALLCAGVGWNLKTQFERMGWLFRLLNAAVCIYFGAWTVFVISII